MIAILILAGRQLFSIKNLVTGQLIGGLYYNFIRMDQARIATQVQVEDTIQVRDTIPVVFDLELDQKTRVVLTEDTRIENATIFLNGQTVPIDIILREGTPLNIQLKMTIPVDQTVPVELDVPVNLTVPVNIPLDQTELHEPFVGLQEVISPYYWQLSRLPDSWSETVFCSTGRSTIMRICDRTIRIQFPLTRPAWITQCSNRDLRITECRYIPMWLLRLMSRLSWARISAEWIERETPGGNVGIGGIRIKLLNVDKDVAIDIVSFSSGQYYYLGLIPGHYRAYLDPEQLDKFGYIADPPSMEFDVLPSESGSSVEHINFVLKDKP